jgi:transposase
MTIAHRVRLTEAERTTLIRITRRGETTARRITRARILLLVDRGTTDRAIADALNVHPRTCQRLRQRACQAGVLAALAERPRPGAPRLLDATQEAQLIALACADAPAGRAEWTMQLLADQLIALSIVETISAETVRRTLKQTT